MHKSLAIPSLVFVVTLTVVQPGFSAPSPTIADRNEARWADWEAQARITEGDYEGAVQAQQQANATRHEADRQAVNRPEIAHPLKR